MDESYREFLMKTILFLEETSGNLFAQILNLASQNEFPNLKQDFESGYLTDFNISMFENSTDPNLIRLVEVYKKIEDEIEALIKKNKITEDELDFHFINDEMQFDDEFDDEFDEFDEEADDELFGDFPMSLN